MSDSAEKRSPCAESAAPEDDDGGRVMGQHVPTAEERYHGAHRRLAEVESQLHQASSWFEEWPSDDAEGARFADNIRMAIDGLGMAVEGLSEIVWGRYGRR